MSQLADDLRVYIVYSLARFQCDVDLTESVAVSATLTASERIRLGGGEYVHSSGKEL